MLSDNIRNYRKANNMSQDELAEKLDVSRQSVSLWENGQTQPTIENIIALAKIFNISTDALLGNTEDVKTATLQNQSNDEIKPQPSAFSTEEEQPSKAEDDCRILTEEKNKVGIGKKAVIGIVAAIVVFISAITAVGISVGSCSKKPTNADVGKDTETADRISETVTDKETETDNETESEKATETEKTTEKATEKITEKVTAKAETTVINTTEAPEPVTEAPKPVTEAPKKQKETTSKPKAETTTKKAETEPVKEEPFDLFEYCKEFAIENGKLNGDYCMYQQPSSLYGGYEGEYFSISYWGDSDMVEFCLHCPIDETVSINFYLQMRGGFDGKYDYSASKYQRSTGDSYLSAYGTIDPSVFSDKYPLSCDSFYGSTKLQSDFMEESRVGMVDLIKCLKNFVKVEKMTCDFEVFGFKKF